MPCHKKKGGGALQSCSWTDNERRHKERKKRKRNHAILRVSVMKISFDGGGGEDEGSAGSLFTLSGTL